MDKCNWLRTGLSSKTLTTDKDPNFHNWHASSEEPTHCESGKTNKKKCTAEEIIQSLTSEAPRKSHDFKLGEVRK